MKSKITKYTPKMEKMILHAYTNAPKDQTREATSTQLVKDLKKVFSKKVSSSLTANGIAQKYYVLRQQDARSYGYSDKEGTILKKSNKEVPKAYTINHVYPQTAPQEKPTSTLRDNIFKAIQESDDLTITIKGTEITVVFK
jgi:hypothetical protein|tara:strand:- start:751 stop:1173 length:423 start_codon:yes stop_codon:yes gene_type:complete